MHGSGDKLFPLRFLDVPPVTGRGKEGRKTRLAAARVREFNEAVYGFHFLAGYGRPAGSSNAQNSIQESVTADIFDFVDQVPVCSGGFQEGSFVRSSEVVLAIHRTRPRVPSPRISPRCLPSRWTRPVRPWPATSCRTKLALIWTG